MKINNETALAWKHGDKHYCIRIERDQCADMPEFEDGALLLKTNGTNIGNTDDISGFVQILANTCEPGRDKEPLSGNLSSCIFWGIAQQYAKDYFCIEGKGSQIEVLAVYGTKTDGEFKLVASETSNPFVDGFEAEASGFIAMTKSQAIHKLSATKKNWREKADEAMKNYIAKLSLYASDKAYAYVLYQWDGDKPPMHDESDADWTELHCIGGFLGDDSETTGIFNEIGFGFEDAMKEDRILYGRAREITTTTYTLQWYENPWKN